MLSELVNHPEEAPRGGDVRGVVGDWRIQHRYLRNEYRNLTRRTYPMRIKRLMSLSQIIEKVILARDKNR